MNVTRGNCSAWVRTTRSRLARRRTSRTISIISIVDRNVGWIVAECTAWKTVVTIVDVTTFSIKLSVCSSTLDAKTGLFGLI